MEEYKQKLVDLLVKYYNSETRTVSQLYGLKNPEPGKDLKTHSCDYFYVGDSKNDDNEPRLIVTLGERIPINGYESEYSSFKVIHLQLGNISFYVICNFVTEKNTPTIAKSHNYDVVNGIVQPLASIAYDKFKNVKESVFHEDSIQNRINKEIELSKNAEYVNFLNKQLELI